MRRKLGFKKSRRDILRGNDAAMQFLCGGAAPAEVLNNLPPKRKYTKRAIAETEAPVLEEIGNLLHSHPRILVMLRFNSGAAQRQLASGEVVPVKFHRWIKRPCKMRLPDFYGLFKTDARFEHAIGAPIAIEAKPRGWKEPRDEREFEQAAFLMMIRNAGGIGIFATSAEQVAEALK